MATEVGSYNAYEDKPWFYTATGTLGDKRNTMMNNQLLLRPELAKPLERGYTLPHSFTYGRPSGLKDGGASEALRGWTSSITLPLNRPKEQKTERDFVGLNKAAVQAGLVNASEQYQFRASHDVRKSVAKGDNNKSRTRRLPPTMVYGISTRPSTPVFDLLEHKYQDKWLAERRAADIAKRQTEQDTRRGTGKVYETRAALLRTYQNPVDSAPLWQLPRFTKNAKPHLETFRSDGARHVAFRHHSSDGISRRGAFAHGIYEPSKS